jgi:hypothetical protein
VLHGLISSSSNPKMSVLTYLDPICIIFLCFLTESVFNLSCMFNLYDPSEINPITFKVELQ